MWSFQCGKVCGPAKPIYEKRCLRTENRAVGRNSTGAEGTQRKSEKKRRRGRDKAAPADDPYAGTGDGNHYDPGSQLIRYQNIEQETGYEYDHTIYKRRRRHWHSGDDIDPCRADLSCYYFQRSTDKFGQ